MKRKLLEGTILAIAGFVIGIFLLAASPGTKKLNVQWFGDGVYYTTNSVWDDERNKTLPAQSYFIYSKTAIITNKVEPFYFRAGDQPVELGARDDGVIVWRKVEEKGAN